MIRDKKENELKAKYEKQIEEEKAEKKDLMDRLEMLENKLKNKELQKTPEQIAEEKNQISQRELRKKEAEEKNKILEAEKKKNLELKKIEDDKNKIAFAKFSKDSD
jgi:hypothetical protein